MKMGENLHSVIRFDKSIMWTIYRSPLKKLYIDVNGIIYKEEQKISWN
jgi:hypothetical protein